MPQPQRFYGPAQMAPIRTTPRWPTQPGPRPTQSQPQATFQNMQGAYRPAARPAAQPGIRSALAARPMAAQAQLPAQIQQPRAQITQAVVNPSQRSNYKYTATMRNPPQTMAQHIVQQPAQQVSDSFPFQTALKLIHCDEYLATAI